MTDFQVGDRVRGTGPDSHDNDAFSAGVVVAVTFEDVDDMSSPTVHVKWKGCSRSDEHGRAYIERI